MRFGPQWMVFRRVAQKQVELVEKASGPRRLGVSKPDDQGHRLIFGALEVLPPARVAGKIRIGGPRFVLIDGVGRPGFLKQPVGLIEAVTFQDRLGILR